MGDPGNEVAISSSVLRPFDRKPLALGTTAQTKDKSKRLMATIISNDYLNYLKG